jgi:hypothetical protein
VHRVRGANDPVPYAQYTAVGHAVPALFSQRNQGDENKPSKQSDQHTEVCRPRMPNKYRRFKVLSNSKSVLAGAGAGRPEGRRRYKAALKRSLSVEKKARKENGPVHIDRRARESNAKRDNEAAKPT